MITERMQQLAGISIDEMSNDDIRKLASKNRGKTDGKVWVFRDTPGFRKTVNALKKSGVDFKHDFDSLSIEINEEIVFWGAYLVERSRTTTFEEDVDDAYKNIQTAISKYEENVETFSEVLARRLTDNWRIDNPNNVFRFKVEQRPPVNTEQSFKNLHYKVKIKDSNMNTNIWLDFYNDKVQARLTHNKKNVASLWAHDTMTIEKFMVKHLEKLL